LDRDDFLVSVPLALAPLDGAEVRISDIIVEQANDSHRLVHVGHARIIGVSCRRDILQRDGMVSGNPHRETSLSPSDVFASLAVVGTYPGYIVFVSRQFEHRGLTEDQTRREKPLRDHAVMVVAVALGIQDRAGGAKSKSGQAASLESHFFGEPPL